MNKITVEQAQTHADIITAAMARVNLRIYEAEKEGLTVKCKIKEELIGNTDEPFVKRQWVHASYTIPVFDEKIRAFREKRDAS